jgi:hypothetical protein
MKRFLSMLATVILINACQENEPIVNDFTGNESTYALSAGSDYPINGVMTFKEKKDKSAFITISLSGTEGNIEHPVHLHMGNISTPDADVVALLNPVLGKTGLSETHLNTLADESSITYEQLLQLNACIKIHLSASGQDKNIILAAGNIGKAISDNTSGRSGITVCRGQ